MKPKKSEIKMQRRMMEKKLREWRKLAREKNPPIGWIKAIRGALGMTTKQLADRMDINQPNVVALEQREAKGTVTLETLEAAARAMHCKVVYAIVPEEPFHSLDEILDYQADKKACSLLKKVSHTMRLEAQDVDPQDKRTQHLRLAEQLKEEMDRRLWSKK